MSSNDASSSGPYNHKMSPSPASAETPEIVTRRSRGGLLVTPPRSYQSLQGPQDGCPGPLLDLNDSVLISTTGLQETTGAFPNPPSKQPAETTIQVGLSLCLPLLTPRLYSRPRLGVLKWLIGWGASD